MVRTLYTLGALSYLLAAPGCADQRSPQHVAGVALPTPYQKPNIWLTDTQGRRFNFRQETQGKLTLVEFGYTHCPDVCPVTMANIAAALAKQPYEFSTRVRVYFVTQDPSRDTPATLRKWLDSFNHDFVGIVGPPGALDTLAAAFNISPPAFDRSSPTDTTYQVGHAAQVIVFTPDNLAHMVYPFGIRQQDWTNDLPKLASVR
jgi:protein SCO1/2